MCFVWISEQTANFTLHNIKRLLLITEVESVYCAVRTESLNNTYVSSLNCFTLRYLAHKTGCFFAGLPCFCKIPATYITA